MEEDPQALSFFLSQPLKELLPFSKSENMSAENYLKIAEMIDLRQRTKLQAVLSSLA